MGIALFTYNYPPLGLYGVERHNERLACYFANIGYSSIIITRGFGDLSGLKIIGDHEAVFRTPSLGIPTGRRFKWLFPLLEYTAFSLFYSPRLIKRFKINVLYGNGTFFGGWQAALVKLITKRRFVLIIHGYGADYYKRHNKTPIMYFFLRWADSIIVQKKSAIDILVKWGIERSKIFYLEEGSVDTNTFKPSTNTKRNGILTVSFVGRLIEFKGPELLLNAVPSILKTNPNVRFLFVGEGPLRQSLQSTVIEQGLEQKVFFLGRVSNIKTIYQKSDVFVALSPYNNFSDLATLEAMACSVPVIATNSGETSKTIIHGWNGLLIEPRNVQELVQSVLKVLNNVELAKQLGTNGRLSVQKNCGIEKMGGQILSIFCRRD